MGLLTGDALWTLGVAVAIFLLLVDLMHRRQRWAARYPPGPMPLPGLGNLLQIDFQNMTNSFQKLRFRFGDVFSLQLAWKPAIVLNGLAAVREALVNHSEDTSDRPWMPVYEHLGLGPRSQGVIMATYGPAWREQRRFSVSTMRNFGLGKKSLERWVTEEASCLCTAFANEAGHPFSPRTLLNKAVCNVISSLIYAHRFEYDDQRLAKILDLLEDLLKEESGLVLNVVPVLLRIPGLPGKVFPAQKAFMALLDELLTEHRMTRDPAQPPRDLTDAFLAEVEKAKGNPESSFNDENLRMVVADLFTAGMVTTSATLAWALLLMILHPDVQREDRISVGVCRTLVTRPCHHISQDAEVLLGLRIPSKGSGVDRGSLPRLVQWKGPDVPIPVPAHARHLLQGTTLVTNLSSVLKDETVWERPLRFHPGHFLDAQGCFVKREAFMPFSAGRRACLGEPLARMELFLFFTCLLQRFTFSVPAGQPRPSDHGVFGAMVTPPPYQLCAVPR
uniref:Cytochrome P450 n=1 Tax=Sciurus vulgaris TaxID=55149 RepID=A0A8D2AWG7_SCIVU